LINEGKKGEKLNTNQLGHRLRQPTGIRTALGLILLLSLLFMAAPGPAQAAGNPAPVQIYYVTLPEADALTVLDAINTAAASPVTTYFSIAIGVSGTFVYYDQWENGYDSDMANPTNLYSSTNPGGTQIWGNGEADDGCAPNKKGVTLTCSDATDFFVAGDIILPSSNIPLPRNSNVILFDAKDKVGASSSIAMARATWAAGSGTLNAFGHEMYPTTEWGTAYEAPVGTNTAYPAQGYSGQGMFEYSALSIMAAQNGTTVYVDADANGSYETNIVLQEGGTYLAAGVRQGARVQTTNPLNPLDPGKPIQVVLLTGDTGSNYESRDMNLLPVSAFGSSYWSPVGVNTGTSFTPGPTRLFLYNPSTNGSSIYITCDRRTPTPTRVIQGPVAARGMVYLDLNNNSGANCFASTNTGAPNTSKVIFGIGTVDTAVSGTSAGQAGDWSFTLYPDNFLSTDALVGLGLGKDPTNASSTENGGPLWVTPACISTVAHTNVYVDWNNDGNADMVDLNGDGDTNDTVDGISEGSSASGMEIARLKSVRLFNPARNAEPYDQSGARVWSRTASGTPGCNLALAWGQDPRTASAGAPGLDVGTSVPPMRLIEGTKRMELKTDTDGDGQLSPGDIATTYITIKNSGSSTVTGVSVYDAGVPEKTDYVAGSTQKSTDLGNTWTGISDDTSGTAFPLDVTGGILLGDLPAGATFYVRFDITLSNLNLSEVYEEVSNCDLVLSSGSSVQNCTTSLVASHDWGDLPESYATSLAANGARHAPSDTDLNQALRLGSSLDRDLQGQPSTNANGDDLNQTQAALPTQPPPLPKADDEDGILIGGAQPAWQSGGTGIITVTVTNGPGCLNAWMDFTNDSGAVPPAPDGNFSKAGGYDTYGPSSEHIIQNVPVNSGTATIEVTVPPGSIGPSGAYFRFRLSPQDSPNTCTTAIAPTGFVSGGEVEDYFIVPADLSVTKTDGKTTVAPGSTIEYTLTIQNHGLITATNVTLEDTLGDHLTYQSSTCGTLIDGSTYAWKLADLAPGASTSCTVTVLVATFMPDGTTPLPDGTPLVNYAHVSTSDLELNITDNESSDIDTIKNVGLPDLWVTKSDGNEQVLAGDTLVYTIQYGNTSAVSADNVKIVDTLPANVEYQSASIPCTTSGSPVNLVTCNVGTVAAGDPPGSVQITVKVKSDQSTGSAVLNRVSIDGDEDDKNPADNSASDSGVIVSPYVVTEKSAFGPNAVGEVIYSIYWYNNSSIEAADVKIVDTLPTGTTLVANSITGGGTESPVGVITWNLGTQAAGASGTLSFRVTLGSTTGDSQTAPTLSTETGAGSVTITSTTTAYTSLPWCDSTNCLAYRGTFSDTISIGPLGWADNPRSGLYTYTSKWVQPKAASTAEAYYWLPAATLDAEWTTVNDKPITSPNYTFFRQAFCTPLNAGDLSASLRLASDDISTIYLNGISVGQHTGAGSYSTFNNAPGIQSGINILAVRLLNNTHGGHPFPACPGCDHSGLLFNLQASYGSLLPFASGPSMTLEDQSVTVSVDENALSGRKPYAYQFDFGDGSAPVIPDPSTPTLAAHTYATPGTYVVTVTARAAYGCTGTDQVTIQVLPANSNLLANRATVSYDGTPEVHFTGETGAGLLLAGTIGDRVWLDEDSDGVQDAGEAGIANVTIQLWNSDHTQLIATTYTDANGNYIFKDVPVGTYQVQVVPGSGLYATYDENGIDTLNITSVTVTYNAEYTSADFGYNWAAKTNVDSNTGTGAIGDRVWIDGDGDGVQDGGEMGLSGVTVDLLTAGTDGLFGTADDVISSTTTTNASGNYIFTKVKSGAYVVRVTAPSGYSPSADLDGTLDNQTTPILLAPGDVYLNADFGYLPGADLGDTIGDTIWLDANANGKLDGDEGRIPGVTVALIKDANGDGVYQPGSDPIVATSITDANGYYQFNGLPVAGGTETGNYWVWINDTQNVLFGLAPTYDANGVSTANISAVTNLAPEGNQLQDFGYAPPGHTPGEQLIGDKVFLDQNNDGRYTPGEGLEGVTVLLYADSNSNGLYDSGEAVVAKTVTNENGSYYFGSLRPGSYVVVVDTTTLPAGLTNTVDPDVDPNTPKPNDYNHQGAVTLTAGQINLLQDFGYQPTANPNSISGTIWKEINVDGILDANGADDKLDTDDDEVGIGGVTVVLRDSSGDIIAATTTDADGNYSFTYLPNGTYTVDVTDDANLLDGYWHSLGTANTNDHSQPDPLSVTLSGSTVIEYADFGYYRAPASAGNFVWLDLNSDGIQDAGEPGIGGVPVRLTIAYPNGDSSTLVVLTDMNGFYSFGSLLLDENHTTSGTGGPTYTISVGTPPSMTPSPADNPATTDKLDSDGADEIVTVLKGEVNLSYDFGFYSNRYDLGDLPSGNLTNPAIPTFVTKFGSGPAHTVFPDGSDEGSAPDTIDNRRAVWLGSTVDTEADGQPSDSAIGDGDDEDGLALVVEGGVTIAKITLNSSSPATVYYGMWIDWFGVDLSTGGVGSADGVFDAFYSGFVQTESSKTIDVPLTIPDQYPASNPFYVRLRVSDQPLSINDSQGTRINGEVEDYRFPLGPTDVSLTSFTARAGSQPAALPAAAAALAGIGGAAGLFWRKRRRRA